MCQWQCGVQVHVRGDEVLKIDGDRRHPLGRGAQCVKGKAALEFHIHPNRLNYPLKRVGERGSSEWERISWDRALDEIAAKLHALRAEFGPEVVVTMAGTEKGPGDWAAWRWACLYGTPNIFTQGKNCGEAAILTECAMYGGHTFDWPVPGLTKTALIWGSNPAESNPIQAMKQVLTARRRGAKIVVIDPRRSETVDKAADVWLQLRPGTDGALAWGLINIIVEDKLYDKEFIDRWCLGFDRVANLAHRYPPERVEEITWVPADELRRVARMFAKSKPSIITWSCATAHLGRDAGLFAEQGKAVLRAITGNLDVPGGNQLGRHFEKLAWAENLHWDKLVDHPQRKRENLSAGEFPIASVRALRTYREAMRSLFPHGYPAAHYMVAPSSPSIWRGITEKKPYPVKAIISQGSNALLTLGNARNIYNALKSPNLELHVVMDFFLTPTAALADYVLPSASWLERPNITVYWGLVNFFICGEQPLKPLHERRDDYHLWRELGIRLGQEEDYWPETLEAMYDKLLAPTGMTFAEWTTREERWHFPAQKHRAYEQTGFATFSGKVELLPSLFEKLGYAPLQEHGEPPRSPLSTPELAREYPFILTTPGRVVAYQHSCYRQKGKLRKGHPHPLVHIHPEPASKLGIAEGDSVWIETPEGRVRQKARVTDTAHPRVVHAEAFWWYPERSAKDPDLFGVWESNINAIMPDNVDLCDYAGDLPFRGLLCRVYKAD